MDANADAGGSAIALPGLCQGKLKKNKKTKKQKKQKNKQTNRKCLYFKMSFTLRSTMFEREFYLNKTICFTFKI